MKLDEFIESINEAPVAQQQQVQQTQQAGGGNVGRNQLPTKTGDASNEENEDEGEEIDLIQLLKTRGVISPENAGKAMKKFMQQIGKRTPGGITYLKKLVINEFKDMSKQNRQYFNN